MSLPSADAIGVRIERVSKRFAHRVKGEVYATRDVSLDVQPGEFLTLLGPSGCGKTTTLRVIAGFERPDAGRVFFDRQEVTGLAANDRGIGFVFQNYALFPHLSVFENIAYGLRVRGQPAVAVSAAVVEVLSLVGLAGYEEQFPAQLSGGEQQRVALARAIVIRPRVLLFDEPLSNLDAKLRLQMRGEIRQLQRRLAITTIYVTHDQEEAMAVSDRIAVMHRGSIVQIGTAQDLYYRPASAFVAQFIGRVNMVTARLEQASSDGASVSALGRLFRIRELPAGAVAGEHLKLVLRPEAIELSRMPHVVGSAPATVLSRSFLGEKIEYELECHGEKLQSVRYNAGLGDLFAEGETVALRCIDDTVIALKDGMSEPSVAKPSEGPKAATASD